MSQQYHALNYTITVRLEYTNNVGMLGKVTTHLVDVSRDLTAIPVRDLNEEHIIRSVFNERVVPSIARAVFTAAIKTGVAHRAQGRKGGEPLLEYAYQA